MPPLEPWQVAVLIAVGVVSLAGLIGLLVWALIPVGKGVGHVVRHLWAFVRSTARDLLRIVACLIVAPIFAVLALASLCIANLAAARKFGVAIREEGVRLVVAMYQLVLGNPARLLGLSPALEGVETRLPGVLTGAWGDAVSPRDALFAGYTIVGTLPQGGSGAKLYIAEPSRGRRREFERAGHVGPHLPTRVVIKSFSTLEDASLARMVREGQALEAGKRLGLILDHGFTPDRFYYVMRYVPGESLRVVTTSMHKQAPGDGLGDDQLRRALGFATDLVSTLEAYHARGLWHKDVKPDNVIIEPVREASGATRETARLVDIGLVSSLRSAMTLTTHGTEYYRDPELVRQALRGVKVHEVDGAKFDVYAAGAVLYSLIEGTFPAQGSLSPITRRCPPSVAWIVRRAMAGYQQRYARASLMLEDLRAALASPDLFAMRPADLPSNAQLRESEASPATPALPAGGGANAEAAAGELPLPMGLPAAGLAQAPTPPAHVPVLASSSESPFARSRGDMPWAGAAPTPGGSDQSLTQGALPLPVVVSPPRVRITNWWTGAFVVEGGS